MDETGIVLVHKPMKVLARSGTNSLHRRSRGNKIMITVIAVFHKSLIDVDILLDDMSMNIWINALHLLLDISHKPFINS